MKINNKRGHVYLAGLVIAPAKAYGIVSVVGAFKVAFIALALAAAWHIPAWDKAKDANTEAAYQKQEMWPQQLFDKLPGGTPGRTNGVVTPVQTASVGGYWEGKMLASLPTVSQ